jgi:hypothetical protein
MPRRTATLKPGEFVRVKLKGRTRYGTFAFIGTVASVDDRAVRLEPAIDMQSHGGLPFGRQVDGAAVIPWSSIQAIRNEPTQFPTAPAAAAQHDVIGVR